MEEKRSWWLAMDIHAVGMPDGMLLRMNLPPVSRECLVKFVSPQNQHTPVRTETRTVAVCRTFILLLNLPEVETPSEQAELLSTSSSTWKLRGGL